jgi:cell division protein FtsL
MNNMGNVARAKTANNPQIKVQRAPRAGGQRSRRSLLGFYGLGLCLVLLGLLHVWLRLQVVHMGYGLSTTTKLQNQLEQENRELKVELASLTSPDRLEAMARKRLGLVPPDKGQVIVLP